MILWFPVFDSIKSSVRDDFLFNLCNQDSSVVQLLKLKPAYRQRLAVKMLRTMISACQPGEYRPSLSFIRGSFVSCSFLLSQTSSCIQTTSMFKINFVLESTQVSPVHLCKCDTNCGFIRLALAATDRTSVLLHKTDKFLCKNRGKDKNTESVKCRLVDLLVWHGVDVWWKGSEWSRFTGVQVVW